MMPATSLFSRLEPVSALPAERQAELAGLCRQMKFPRGSDPLAGLETRGQLVYLLAGELKIDLPGGGSLLLVGACGDARWPLGRHGGMPRSGKAITALELLLLDKTQLDILLTWEQLSLHAGLPAHAALKTGSDAVRTGLFSARDLVSGALACLPPANIQEMLRRLERLAVRRGELVVRAGEAGEHYYVIESGRCEVTRAVGGTDLLVAELKAGDAFGEEALLSGEPRNASVRMKTNGVLWRLAKPDFVALLQAPLLHAIRFSVAQERVAAGHAVWLDVRYPAEYARDGLPGAINIPLNEVRSAFAALDGGRQYIVYCQSGRRSSAAAFLLAQSGLDACWLEGGLDAVRAGDSGSGSENE